MLGLFFVVPVLPACALSLTDFDSTRWPTCRTPALRRLRQLCAAAADAAVLEGARQHLLVRRRRRAAVDRPVARRGDAAQLAARALARPVPHRAVRAGRHHAGRGRGDLALPAPHPLRHDQLRARARSASRRSTGSATRARRCRRSSLFAVWKNFGYNMVIFLAALQTMPRRPLRGGADRRRRRAGSGSATSPCRRSRRRCCWSRS